MPFISSIVAFIMQKLGYAVQMAVMLDGGVQLLVNGYRFLVVSNILAICGCLQPFHLRVCHSSFLEEFAYVPAWKARLLCH